MMLLEVSNLKISFNSVIGKVKAVDGVSFHIEEGRTLGIAGESGSGKSITSLGIMNLVPKPNGYIEDGSILFDGKNILAMDKKAIRRLRGNEIAMIFQEPMTSLNPVFTIGKQIGEVFKIHKGLNGKANKLESIEMLKKVNIPRAEEIMDEYPHQLSGGMRQRVMIAMALACSPKLLIADEPTTALDVTIQAQVLKMMKNLSKEMGTAILLITHDLGVIAEMADDIAIMYAGKVVEYGNVIDVLKNPMHPYTKGLIRARPDNYTEESGYYCIPGKVAKIQENHSGCSFYPRCEERSDICREKNPEEVTLVDGRRVSCFKRNVSKEGYGDV